MRRAYPDVSAAPVRLPAMAKTRTILACSSCRQQVSQWVGRCPGCGAWGTIEEAAGTRATGGPAPARVSLVGAEGPVDEGRVTSGFAGIDRVLGGGLVPASVALLAGEPGIGKSTLLLHLLGHLSAAGHTTLLVSGEESHAQVAARARRLGIDDRGDRRSRPVAIWSRSLQLAREARPFLLAVDSIQTIRDTAGTQMPGRRLAGAHVHRRAGGAREGRGHRRAADRSRHEGRRPRGTPRARARRRRRPDLRRRSTVGAARARGRQEPVRRRRRDRPGSRWAATGSARSIRPTCS